MSKEQKGNYYSFFITVVIVGLLVVFMPEIYKFLDHQDTPKIENQASDDKQKEEPITLDSAVVKSLFVPVMRIDNYEKFTYYQKDIMTISDMSNSDLLINAFLQLYDGSFSAYEGNANGSCLNYNDQKQLKEIYIKSEIESKLGKNITFTYEDFTVPISTGNQYAGKWHYDSAQNIFIYKGTCDKTKTTSYYDLVSFYDVESEDNDKTLYVYAYVAFAKLENGSYVIYQDVDLTKEITSGSANTIEELNLKFKDYVKDNPVNTYKYTYKKGLCTYGEYCLDKGEWING